MSAAKKRQHNESESAASSITIPDALASHFPDRGALQPCQSALEVPHEFAEFVTEALLWIACTL